MTSYHNIVTYNDSKIGKLLVVSKFNVRLTYVLLLYRNEKASRTVKYLLKIEYTYAKFKIS